MNTAILMLGSNANATQNIELAREKILELYEIISTSSQIVTKPIGNQYKWDFTNEAIIILSDETAENTKENLKQIEKDLGRTMQSKQLGIIPIDIDIIIWNDTIIHRDYERFEFVRNCVDEVLI